MQLDRFTERVAVTEARESDVPDCLNVQMNVTDQADVHRGVVRIVEELGAPTILAQAAAHLLASIPHDRFLEYFHPQQDPIWHNVIANRPELKGGHIELPTGPGLGWELDLDYNPNHNHTVVFDRESETAH